MKKISIAVSLLFLIFISYTRAELLFQPLTSNIFEPRIGAHYDGNSEKLRLDIGHSQDFTKFRSVDNINMSIGADFFTYSRLRTESNFKFPVETIDYLFGLNSAMVIERENIDYSARFRLSHISAHLVDGFADSSIFRKEPYVYSHEFLELALAADFAKIISPGADNMRMLRLYLNGRYNFSKIPEIIPDLTLAAGFDTGYKFSENLPFEFLGGAELLYNPVDTGNEDLPDIDFNSQFGIIYRTSEFAGIYLSAFYHSGKSYHGLFFTEKEDFFGIGFQLIFY